ncbi:MAG: response regulator transcription factor [Prevotella sp.]|jgi:DNA-binding response OmpR family regulator|nr:response regulator transcription factor [Prevotella sp.]
MEQKDNHQQYRICMAEDEANISDFVSRGLSEFGYQVDVFNNGEKAWEALKTGNPHDTAQRNSPYDLLLLDIRMPRLSGIEVCQLFRDKYGYQTPVIMLTALSTTDDIIMGLHAGADDYLSKPFKFMELLARIEALLRRSSFNEGHQLFHYANLTIDPSSHKAHRGDVSVDLSTKEYRLLEYFIRHHGEVLSRRQLLKNVWDRDFDTNTNIVEVYVKYIRSKIDDPFDHKLIHTIVGIGYMMKE